MHRTATRSKGVRPKLLIEPRNAERIHSFCVGGCALWRYEDNLGSHSSGTSHLFHTGSLISMYLHQACYTSWPACQLHGSAYDLTVNEITSTGHHPNRKVDLGIQTQILTLSGQVLCQPSHLPSSEYTFYGLAGTHWQIMGSEVIGTLPEGLLI